MLQQSKAGERRTERTDERRSRRFAVPPFRPDRQGSHRACLQPCSFPLAFEPCSRMVSALAANSPRGLSERQLWGRHFSELPVLAGGLSVRVRWLRFRVTTAPDLFPSLTDVGYRDSKVVPVHQAGSAIIDPSSRMTTSAHGGVSRIWLSSVRITSTALLPRVRVYPLQSPRFRRSHESKTRCAAHQCWSLWLRR